MILEIIRAFSFIFIAEMGDKTQILAMAFATKYDVKKVLLGIFLGAFFNHGIAVLLGSIFSNLVSDNIISVFAGLAFISFGLWSLKMNETAKDKEKKAKFGPVFTVALAFFIGELGDKTQLTAIALAASSTYPLFILIGTVLGMVVTGALGIYIGIKLGSKIPEFYIKLGAALIFLTFGFLKLFSSLNEDLNKIYYIIPFVLIVLVLAYLILKPTLSLRKLGVKSLMQKTAEELHFYYNDIAGRLEDICLGESVCGVCLGKNCLVGYTKMIIEKTKNGEEINLEYIENLSNQKNFSRELVIESLRITIQMIKEDPNNIKYIPLHLARNNFETILLGTYIKEFDNYEIYLNNLTKIDKIIAKRIKIN